MLKNGGFTIYHKGFDKQNRVETWTRFNYPNAWFFGGQGARLNKGFDEANDVKARVSYLEDEKLNIKNFAIGDIIVKGSLDLDITTQQDLKDYVVYNITSINNNDFGLNPHIHIEGK